MAAARIAYAMVHKTVGVASSCELHKSETPGEVATQSSSSSILAGTTKAAIGVSGQTDARGVA